jgi:hypothetical protein
LRKGTAEIEMATMSKKERERGGCIDEKEYTR